MELSRTQRGDVAPKSSRERIELWSDTWRDAPRKGSQTRSLLAPLAVGDELPWKLSREGHPQWLVVIEVIGTDRYVVQYPDGATEVLVDSA